MSDEAGSLRAAAGRGDVPRVTAILRRAGKAAADEQDGRGRAALHEAASGGHTAAVNALLEAGAAPNCRDAHGKSPIALAAEAGHAAVVAALARVADVNAADSFGRTALHWAARAADHAVLAALASGGGDGGAALDCSAATNSGDSALHWLALGAGEAASDDSTAAAVAGFAEELLRRGASVRARNEEGRTALDVLAARSSSSRAAQELQLALVTGESAADAQVAALAASKDEAGSGGGTAGGTAGAGAGAGGSGAAEATASASSGAAASTLPVGGGGGVVKSVAPLTRGLGGATFKPKGAQKKKKMVVKLRPKKT